MKNTQKIGIKCSLCDAYHDEVTRNWSFIVPKYYHQHIGKPPAGAIATTFDSCVIDDMCFTKGVLDIPVLGTSTFLSVEMWVSLRAEHFHAFTGVDDHTQEGRQYKYPCTLANNIPGFPNALKLTGELVTRGTKRKPQVRLHKRVGHPLWDAYYNGIAEQQVNELFHRYGGVRGKMRKGNQR